MHELTFRTEKYSDIASELMPLIAKHWEEMPFDESVPLDPDLTLYAKMDNSDKLQVTTGRTEDGRLVGYFVVFVSRHPHYDFLMAAMDIYFIEPEFRRAANGIRLFEEMEDALRMKGVRYVVATSRMDRNSGGPLFERMGWKGVRMVWEKRLEE